MRIATRNLSIPHRGACAAAIALCASFGLGISSARAATVRILDASAPESAPSVKFKVKIGGNPAAPIRVTYSTISGSAISGSDFKVAKGQLSFQPEKKEKTIVVKLIPDSVMEAKETFGLKLWKPDGASITRARATGTIKDNDPPHSLAAEGAATSGPPPAPKVVVNEVMDDPWGTEADFEYVELLNAGTSAVDLNGWTIDSGTDCALSGTLAAGATHVVSNDISIQNSICTLALTNAGDTVTVRDGPTGSGSVIDTVDYTGFATATGESISLDPSKADTSENDLAASWCKAKEAGASSYDSEGNFGSPGRANGPCH